MNKLNGALKIKQKIYKNKGQKTDTLSSIEVQLIHYKCEA